MSQNRRTFLRRLGGAAAAFAGLGPARSALVASPSGRRLTKIGIQLYTLRSRATVDLGATLTRLAQIGYREVEFAGYYNHSAIEIRDLLRRNGLSAPSAHIALAQVETGPDQTFQDARTIGHDWITVPSLPPSRRETVDDWKRVAAQLNAAGARVKNAGLRFAYHNHNVELRRVGASVPLEVLLAETNPSLVSFEMDIYWVVSGGGDPASLLARYPGRFKMLHIKDSMGPPAHKIADVGSGIIDFKSIIANAKGVEHYFVEHDMPVDPYASASASYAYLANLRV